MVSKDLALKAGRLAWRRVMRFSRSVAMPKTRSAFSWSDAQLLSQFDLPEVCSALRQGNVSLARQALLQHYQNRRKPAWPAFPSRFTDAAELSTEELMDRARDLLEHRFGQERIFLGEKINWSYNPTSDPTARWTRQHVHRHRWMGVLAAAYERTGEEVYAREFRDLTLDWIRSNPLAPHKDELNVAWELMGTGIRASIWVAAFASFYRSRAFTDEAKLIMLRSIYDHAQFLFRYHTHLNHVLRESYGLLCLGIYFPEFRLAASWRETALQRLEHELVEHVNQEGTSVEMSTGYQWLIAEEFEATRALLKEHNLTLPKADLDTRIVKLYSVLAYVLRPDGIWPRIDDGFMSEDATGRKKLAAAGDALARPDIVYVATGGARGAKPDQTSIAYKNIGIYVMRSDWTSDARYLLLDAGPFGGPHGHEDKLGIEVFAYGKPFIVDPGCHTYNVKDPYRAYFASSRAHSTAMVAGKSQVRRWNRQLLLPKAGAGEPATWITRPEFDYVEGAYRDGYGSFEWKKPRDAPILRAVTHTRRVLFVKPDYWLIVDELKADSQRHDYEILFNLAPDIKHEPISERSIRLRSDDGPARLYMATHVPCPYAIHSITGSTDPIQGWYANGWHEKKIPTTTLICRIEGAQSVLAATLLFPSREEQPIDLQPQPVMGGAGLAYRVTSKLGVDYLMLSSDDKEKAFGPCTSDASIAGFRTRGENTAQLLSWHAGAEL